MLVAALSDGLNLSHLVEHLSSLIGCSVEHRRIKLVSESKHLAVCKILSHHCDACLIGWIWCSMIPFRASVHIWQKVVKSKPKTCTIILKIAQFLHFHSHTYTYVYVVYIYITPHSFSYHVQLAQLLYLFVWNTGNRKWSTLASCLHHNYILFLYVIPFCHNFTHGDHVSD